LTAKGKVNLASESNRNPGDKNHAAHGVLPSGVSKHSYAALSEPAKKYPATENFSAAGKTPSKIHLHTKNLLEI